MFCLLEHKNFTLMEFCTSLAGGIQHFVCLVKSTFFSFLFNLVQGICNFKQKCDGMGGIHINYEVCLTEVI